MSVYLGILLLFACTYINDPMWGVFTYVAAVVCLSIGAFWPRKVK